MISLASVRMLAQDDVSFSHYWKAETYYNPASVGRDNKLNIVAAYNNSFTGFENNPKTMYASADVPFYALKNYHGVGASFVNDQIGLFSHTRFNIQYAYRHQLFGGMLSGGIVVSMISETLDLSKAEVDDSSDPVFSGGSSITGSGFDFGAGLYYKHNNWFAGVSVLHAFAPTIDIGDKNEYTIDRTYYLLGGYNIKLRNPFIKIHTSVMGRTDGVAYRGDLTARLVYTNEKRMLYGGVGYSPTNSVTAYIGGSFHGVHLGYSYEFYTSKISAANGSHELMVSYQMDMDFGKKGRNKHKSVRIL